MDEQELLPQESLTTLSLEHYEMEEKCCIKADDHNYKLKFVLNNYIFVTCW